MSATAPRPGRSRRLFLTGATAGAAAAAAQAVSSPAQAENGDPMILGRQNSASSTTGLTAEVPSTGGVAFTVRNTGLSSTGLEASGLGVGLRGVGGTTGVQGVSHHPNGPGVLGECNTESRNDRGVVGTSHIGQGVAGYTETGTGLFGTAFRGGKALEVNGRAFFSRSGTLVIPAGTVSATKTAVALTSDSMVLATVQQNVKGVWIRAAVPNVSTNSFEIFLSKKPKSPVTVAWFIVN